MITQLRRAVPIVFEPAPKDRGSVCEDESGNTLSSWISAPGGPIDLGGPVDRPFDRMGPEFSCFASHEHLTRVAVNFPDKIAISDGACQFSYSELLTKVLGPMQLRPQFPAGKRSDCCWAIRSGIPSRPLHAWRRAGHRSRSTRVIRSSDLQTL